MNTHDKTVGFFDKLSHIIAYSYISHFVCGLLAYDGRNWWTEYSVTWYRGAINFFLSSFAIAINSILVCIFMKKAAPPVKSPKIIVNWIVAVVPIVLAWLSIILDLVLIQ